MVPPAQARGGPGEDVEAGGPRPPPWAGSAAHRAGQSARLINDRSLLLQQQAQSSHSSPPSECLNHAMDSRATGFCSSGSSSGNEGNYRIPAPLLAAVNLPQKNGPCRQLLRAA